MESIMVKQIKTSCERQRKETGGKKTMKKLGGKQVLAGALSAAMVLGSAMPAMAATGWNQNTTGWWWENSDGSYVVNNWVQDAGKWYFMDGNGYMSRGWIWDNGSWFFADASGAMLTGWVRVDGSVYYLNPVSDGTQGAMVTGTRTIDGVEYTFDASGACMNSTSYNRDEIPSYYGNGSAAVENEAARGGSGGGSSSSSNNGSNTTTTVEDVKEALEASTGDAVNAATEAGLIANDENQDAPLTGISYDDASTTVSVSLNQDAAVQANKTVSDISDVLTGIVQDATADMDIDTISYNSPSLGELSYESVDAAVAAMETLFGERPLNTLSSSYKVTLTLENNSTLDVTFDISGIVK